MVASLRTLLCFRTPFWMRSVYRFTSNIFLFRPNSITFFHWHTFTCGNPTALSNTRVSTKRFFLWLFAPIRTRGMGRLGRDTHIFSYISFSVIVIIRCNALGYLLHFLRCSLPSYFGTSALFWSWIYRKSPHFLFRNRVTSFDDFRSLRRRNVDIFTRIRFLTASTFVRVRIRIRVVFGTAFAILGGNSNAFDIIVFTCGFLITATFFFSCAPRFYISIIVERRVFTLWWSIFGCSWYFAFGASFTAFAMFVGFAFRLRENLVHTRWPPILWMIWFTCQRQILSGATWPCCCLVRWYRLGRLIVITFSCC